MFRWSCAGSMGEWQSVDISGDLELKKNRTIRDKRYVLLRCLRWNQPVERNEAKQSNTTTAHSLESIKQWWPRDIIQNRHTLTYLACINLTQSIFLPSFLTINPDYQNGQAYFLPPLRNHRHIGRIRPHAPLRHHHPIHQHPHLLLLPLHGRGHDLGRRIPPLQSPRTPHVQNALWYPRTNLHGMCCILCLLYCPEWGFADWAWCVWEWKLGQVVLCSWIFWRSSCLGNSCC